MVHGGGGFLLDLEHSGVLKQLSLSLSLSLGDVCLETCEAALCLHGGSGTFLHGLQGLAECD